MLQDTCEHKILVVDNGEDNVNNIGININVSREEDVEIGSETAVIPDTTEDNNDDDDIAKDEEEYPLPVINTTTSDEVLGISQ